MRTKTVETQIAQTEDSLSKLRVKVAELCGYSNFSENRSHAAIHRNLNSGCWLPIPDYPNDLNACHEFEKTIMDDPDTWHRYGNELAKASDQLHYREHYCSSRAMASFAHISATQRCLAFVKTMESDPNGNATGAKKEDLGRKDA